MKGSWGDWEWHFTYMPILTFVGMLPSLPIIILMLIKRNVIRIRWIYAFLIYIFINIAFLILFIEEASNCC